MVPIRFVVSLVENVARDFATRGSVSITSVEVFWIATALPLMGMHLPHATMTSIAGAVATDASKVGTVFRYSSAVPIVPAPTSVPRTLIAATHRR